MGSAFRFLSHLARCWRPGRQWGLSLRCTTRAFAEGHRMLHQRVSILDSLKIDYLDMLTLQSQFDETGRPIAEEATA